VLGALVVSALVGYALQGYNDQGFFLYRVAFVIGSLLGVCEAALRLGAANGLVRPLSRAVPAEGVTG
jgi:hypothetical protein